MKSLILAASFLFVISTAVPAADSAAQVQHQPDVTISMVLGKQVGQSVELRLKSGEKIGGKIEKVGQLVVHLSQLTGQELFEAIVAIDEVAAVVMRAKTK